MTQLKDVAREALSNFEAIANAAAERLRQSGVSLGSLANPNAATSDSIAREMQSMNEQRIGDCKHLRRVPTIARIVVTDDDENLRVIYVSPVGTVDVKGITSCSYMSDMGRMLELAVGQGEEISTGNGRRWFYLQEKLLFTPGEWGGEWDARPGEYYTENKRARTIKSLRGLLREAGVPVVDVDPLAEWLADEGGIEGENIILGLQRDALKAMELRVKAALDQHQGAIMRLPLNSRIALLGPPGTGKTTTLIKRLRKTLDFQYIGSSERALVLERDGAGLDHADSWIMFAPTELLCEYVKDALGQVGVPVHDERLRTWKYHRIQIGKNALGILARGSGGGLYIKDDDDLLAPDTLINQIPWYEAFEGFQQERFIEQLAAEAQHLYNSEDVRHAALGQRVLSGIERGKDKSIQILGEIAGFSEDLRDITQQLAPDIKATLDAPIQAYAKADNGFLPALLDFVNEFSSDEAEEIEEDSDDDEEDIDAQPTLTGRRMAADVFRKAMRARAIGQAVGRAPGSKTRAGRLLAFLDNKGLALPDLKDVGRQLLVQRAARRLARASNAWLSGLPLRYRQFRRAMLAEKRFYGRTPKNAMEAHPAEVDLIILAILQHARAMESDALLRFRLADQRPPLMDAVARIRRNQILVDEATDFSPIELAIMRNLTSPNTNALFISGDFNQRLTVTGVRSEDELKWAVPNVQIERINISYRQSRKLAEFANLLARLQGAEVDERAPDDLINVGFAPVLGTNLNTNESRANWLAKRIREIGQISGDVMPTIAVFAPEEAMLEPLAASLSAQLEPLNIAAVACPKGKVKGMAGDVRLFDVQHIKGLEFEAVFFVDVDNFAQNDAVLFDRYIYVGATRAATFLGLTCAHEKLPSSISVMASQLGMDWSDQKS